MEVIKKYFSDTNPIIISRLQALKPLYEDWNSKINVISRKDLDNFYINHVLHSLAIAQLINFKPGTTLMDVGTGGGFPGIPLAIFFPQCQFTLVDSIGKKIKVVNEVAGALELKNVVAVHERAENIPGKFDFIVSRAVTALPGFMQWVKGKTATDSFNDLPNGILYLKGGDFGEELASLKFKNKTFPIAHWFEEEFFETKKIVHIYP